MDSYPNSKAEHHAGTIGVATQTFYNWKKTDETDQNGKKHAKKKKIRGKGS